MTLAIGVFSFVLVLLLAGLWLLPSEYRAAREWIRNILAVIAGWFVGSSLNMGLVLLNAYVLFPMPEGMSMEDPEQMNAYVAGLPTIAFLVVLTAHLGQAFVGGWTAARLGASRPVTLAMIIGGVSLYGGILTMRSIPGPAWMYVELPLYLVLAWLAGKIEVRRRAKAAELKPATPEAGKIGA